MPADLQKIRDALILIGAMASPGTFEPQEPNEWAVLVVGAAVQSETQGSAAHQDALIEAVGLLIGQEPGTTTGEKGHGVTLEAMAQTTAARALGGEVSDIPNWHEPDAEEQGIWGRDLTKVVRALWENGATAQGIAERALAAIAEVTKEGEES